MVKRHYKKSCFAIHFFRLYYFHFLFHFDLFCYSFSLINYRNLSIVCFPLYLSCYYLLLSPLSNYFRIFDFPQFWENCCRSKLSLIFDFHVSGYLKCDCMSQRLRSRHCCRKCHYVLSSWNHTLWRRFPLILIGISCCLKLKCLLNMFHRMLCLLCNFWKFCFFQ